MADLTKLEPVTTVQKIDAEVVKRELQQKRRGHLGASIIGESCNRKLWYSFRWARKPGFSGRLYRLFNRGHREEDQLIEYLELAGVRVETIDPNTGKQYSYSAHGGHFAGSMDGAALGLVEAPKTWHVLEFKTSSAKYFKELQEKGVQESKPQHFAQMQMYMHWSGMERAFYLAVNKNTDELYSERVKYDKLVAESLMAKAEKIINATEPPERISNDPSWYECKWCDYHDICHGQAVPDMNCRTCLHSSAITTGGTAQWKCEKQQPIARFAESGCMYHLFIPALIKFATVEDASQDENWVQYRLNDQCGTFRNVSRENTAEGCFSSSQIAGGHAHQITERAA